MKKSVLMLLCLFMTFAAMAGDPPKTAKPGNAIPLNPPLPIPHPRQVVECDIEAFYEDGVITLNFTEDLGEATVFVINENTGESWVDSVEAFGYALINISDDYGHYVITISTVIGDYYGEFTL